VKVPLLYRIGHLFELLCYHKRVAGQPRKFHESVCFVRIEPSEAEALHAGRAFA
jgi:hypothetical protein